MTLLEKYDIPHVAERGKQVLKTFRVDRWPRNRYEAILTHAGTGNVVLDVGCSNGILLYNLKGRFQKFVGQEYSPAALAQAKINLAELTFVAIPGSAEDMGSIPSGSIDVVISADVIEHIPDVYAAADELFRVLAPGGRLVINTANIASIMKRLRLAAGRFPGTSLPNEGLGATRDSDPLFDGGHLHYFTYRSLSILLQRAGFQIDRRIGFGPFGKLHQVWPALLSGGLQLLAKKPS